MYEYCPNSALRFTLDRKQNIVDLVNCDHIVVRCEYEGTILLVWREPQATDGFSSQMVSNAESVSMLRRHN